MFALPPHSAHSAKVPTIAAMLILGIAHSVIAASHVTLPAIARSDVALCLLSTSLVCRFVLNMA